MLADIFFISYRESNREENWRRVLSFHPDANHIHGIKGIDNAHMTCNYLCKHEFFYTIDGDNWLTGPLDYSEHVSSDLVMFKSIDPLFQETTLLGGVKLWRKNSIINPDLSKGDFSLNATKDKQIIDKVYSITQYNSNPFDAWKTSFRHCVKLMSCIFRNRPNASNINLYIERWASTVNIKIDNAEWAHRGYLDAIEFVRIYDNTDQLYQINDFDWLENYYGKKYETS